MQLVGRARFELATNGLKAETADCLIFIYQSMPCIIRNACLAATKSLLALENAPTQIRSGYTSAVLLRKSAPTLHTSIAGVPINKFRSLVYPVCDRALTIAQHLWLLNYHAMSLIVRAWLLNHYLNTIPTCAMRRTISAPCVPVCCLRLQLKA